MALIDKLTNVADAIRGKTGKEEPLTLDQMATEISAIDTQAKTYILMDEDGNEIPAVLVDEPVEITATANDIRIGTTAVTGDGVTVGTKEIPSYHTTFGSKIITAGSRVVLRIPDYDYTKLQLIICLFNTSMNNSVAAEKVVIDNKVYAVRSTEILSTAVIDTTNGCVDFGIVNDSDKPCILRYSSYKEIY
jgi:hypothetical protein